MAKHLHERRKITFQEYGALLATRALLERNDLKFTPGKSCPLPGTHAFNMNTKGSIQECGSVGCIGGTMAMILGVDPFNYVHDHDSTEDGYVFGYEMRRECSKSLANLFYPPAEPFTSSAVVWKWATPKVAVQAIDNWLKDGKPRWAKLKAEAIKPKACDYRIKRHK